MFCTFYHLYLLQLLAATASAHQELRESSDRSLDGVGSAEASALDSTSPSCRRGRTRRGSRLGNQVALEIDGAAVWAYVVSGTNLMAIMALKGTQILNSGS